MAENSKIEWTDATWNPITGCTIVSPGCTHCYAMKLAGGRLKHHPSRKGLTMMTKAGPVWNGTVRFNESWLTQPLEWKQPRMIFVCAHGDLFHEDVPDEWINRVFDIMGAAQHHTFQVLTKRSARMRAWAEKAVVQHHLCGGDGCNYCGEAGGNVRWKDHSFPNVWLGVSAERQEEAGARIPDLLVTPAAVRFVSLEPLLGPIDLNQIDDGAAHREIPKEEWGTVDDEDSPPALWWDALTGRRTIMHGGANGDWSRTDASLDWIIVGGESGNGARPMHPDWVRSLRDQCAAAGKLDRFFFKQWGAWAPFYYRDDGEPKKSRQLEGGIAVHRIGKKTAGRFLDNVEHNGMPI